MKRSMITVACLAALVCGALWSVASATDVYNTSTVTLTIPTLTPQPDRAELWFGPSAKIEKVESKSDGIIAITSLGDSVYVDFNGKLAATTSVQFSVTTSTGSLAFVNGRWKNAGAINPTAIASGDVLITDRRVPGASTVGLIVISLLTLGTGIFVLRRRPTATA